MRFFEKQKVDQIGVTSVALQKILLFFMILSLLSLFNGGLISYVLCAIGFLGAYKRHPGLLRTYYVVSIALIVAVFILSIVAVAYVANGQDSYYNSGELLASSSSSSSSSSSDHPSANSTVYASTVRFSVFVVRRLASYDGHKTEGSEQASSSSSSSSFTFSSSDYYSPPSDGELALYIAIFICAMIFAFVLIYLKVYSLVLAFRVRKMILAAAANSLPTTTVSEEKHEFRATNTSCAIPETTPGANPASPYPAAAAAARGPMPPTATFMPFQPMMMQPPPAYYGYPPSMMMMHHPSMMGSLNNNDHQQQQPFPPQMMYGQQPIYYSYGPAANYAMPPNPEAEKL